MPINTKAQASSSLIAKRRLLYSRMCLAAVVVLLLASPLNASQPNYLLCFPPVVGLPVLTPGTDPCGHPLVAGQPPTIDGCVIGDPGWTGAFRYVFGNGTAFPNAAIQGIQNSSSLYLSVEVNNAVTFSAEDIVVLIFSPAGGVTANDRRIIIYPNAMPLVAHYWTDSFKWNSAPPQPTFPSDIIVSSTQHSTSTNNAWYVEIQIPLTGPDGFNRLTSGNFGFYFNVVRANSNAGTATEYFWPSFNGNGIDATNPETTTQPSTNWGNGTLSVGSGCKGVSLDYQDITNSTTHMPPLAPDQIDATCPLGPPNCNNSNTFTATLHNTSVDGNGVAVAANGIVANFSIANFGMPSLWTPVPVGTPPGQAGPVNLTPSCGTSGNPACPPLSTNPAWNINTSALITKYQNNADQCILVDLDSANDCNANPGACITLVNKSVKRNMWVLTASEVSKTAEISAKGYAPNLKHPAQQEFTLHVLSRQEVLNPNQQPLSRTATAQGVKIISRRKEGRVVSRFTWAVDGCRLTGEYIIIRGRKYEVCDDVGAFGAIVEHFGAVPVTNWQTSLEGPGLSKVDDAKDTYRLLVPQDGVAEVNVRFAPEEHVAAKYSLAVFLDLGAGIPHGTFSNAFDPGFSLNGGLEYIVNPHFSAEGIFGYHHFPAKIVGDVNLYQFSVNGKTYLTTGKIQPFVNGGIGGYKFSPGSANFGGNVGGGVLFNLTSRLGLQGSYNFHAVNTPVAATTFSTFQGGIRLVF